MLVLNKERGDLVDANAIVQLINTVGFPIAVCVALMWNTVKIQEQASEQTDKFTEALNKNTLVLSRLCQDLEKEDEVNEIIG